MGGSWRTASAWILGLLAFVALTTLAGMLGEAIEVPVYIDFGETIVVEHQFYDEEKDGAFTTFGLASLGICGLLASRFGMALFHRSWNGGVQPAGNVQYLAWLSGLCIYGLFGILFFLASRGVRSGLAQFLLNVLDLLVAVAIAGGMKVWSDRRVATLPARTQEPKETIRSAPMATAAQRSGDPTASFTKAERLRFEKIDPRDQKILISVLENQDAANLDEAIDRLATLGNYPVE